MRWSRLPPVVAHVAQLADAPDSSACDEQRVALADQRVRRRGRCCARPRRCAGRRPASSSIASTGRRETSTRHVGRATPSLHQVDEVRAAAEVGARPAARPAATRTRGVAGPLVGEGLIAPTSAIAARCSRRRRSGTGCRSCARGSRRRRARRRAEVGGDHARPTVRASASMPTAEQICPGVQYPHWNASCSMKASCSGCSVAAVGQPLDRRDVDRPQREARVLRLRR